MAESVYSSAFQTADTQLTLALYQGFGPGLEAKWLQAMTRRGQADLFQHPAWHSAYFAAQQTLDHQPCNPVIGVVSDHQGPSAVLPFTLTTRREHGLPLRTLELMRPCDMGVRNLVLDPALDPERLWQLWLQTLAGAGIGWDLIDCSDALAGSDAQRFAQAAPRPAVSYYHHDSNRLANRGDAAQARQAASKSHLKKTKRKANALAKLGTLDYRLTGAAPTQPSACEDQSSAQTPPHASPSSPSRGDSRVARTALDQALAHYVAVEDASWKGSAGERTSMRHDPVQHAFYQSLMSRHDACITPVAAELLLDGKPIAVELCAEVGDTLFMLKITYDDAYRDHSPGNVLLSWLLDTYASREHIAHVSFITSGDWTLRWHPERQPADVFCIYNYTPRGLLAAAVAKAVNRARTLKRQRAAQATTTEADTQS